MKELCNRATSVLLWLSSRRRRGVEEEENRARRWKVRQWCNTVWLWHALSPLYEKKKKSVCSRNGLRWRHTHRETGQLSATQSIPEQQDDVTALNYPWCFAGKMNEVGHVEGVNEDKHLYFICILIMWSDSYTTQSTGKKKERRKML